MQQAAFLGILVNFEWEQSQFQLELILERCLICSHQSMKTTPRPVSAGEVGVRKQLCLLYVSLCIGCCVEDDSDPCLQHIWHMVTNWNWYEGVGDRDYDSSHLIISSSHIIDGEKLVFLQHSCSHPNVTVFNILTFAETIYLPSFLTTNTGSCVCHWEHVNIESMNHALKVSWSPLKRRPQLTCWGSNGSVRDT